MAIDAAKRQARWLRNKRAERSRQRPAPPISDATFVQNVWKERDLRAASAYLGVGCWPEFTYLSGARLERAIALAADVWAVETLHDAQWGQGTATPTLIRDTLKSMSRTHGYTDGSLRKMIVRARERVKLLESNGEPWRGVTVFWPPFDQKK